MRCLLIALTLFTSTTAYAQPIFGGGQTPPMKQTPASPTHEASSRPQPPPPQAVPPPMLFPLPPLMTQPAGGLTSGFPGFFSSEARGPRRTTPFHRHAPFGTAFYGGFVPGYAIADEPVERARPAVVEAPGALRLSVTPGAAQVFVDGFYVATVDDIVARHDLTLEPGPHRIEIRAPEYQTLTFDVRITPRELVTYRGALELVRPMAPAPRAATQPAGPMYVIPNCYIGNVPPRPSRLASGCDIKQVQVLGKR